MVSSWYLSQTQRSRKQRTELWLDENEMIVSSRKAMYYVGKGIGVEYIPFQGLRQRRVQGLLHSTACRTIYTKSHTRYQFILIAQEFLENGWFHEFLVLVKLLIKSEHDKRTVNSSMLARLLLYYIQIRSKSLKKLPSMGVLHLKLLRGLVNWTHNCNNWKPYKLPTDFHQFICHNLLDASYSYTRDPKIISWAQFYGGLYPKEVERTRILSQFDNQKLDLSKITLLIQEMTEYLSNFCIETQRDTHILLAYFSLVGLQFRDLPLTDETRDVFEKAFREVVQNFPILPENLFQIRLLLLLSRQTQLSSDSLEYELMDSRINNWIVQYPEYSEEVYKFHSVLSKKSLFLVLSQFLLHSEDEVIWSRLTNILLEETYEFSEELLRAYMLKFLDFNLEISASLSIHFSILILKFNLSQKLNRFVEKIRLKLETRFEVFFQFTKLRFLEKDFNQKRAHDFLLQFSEFA